MLRMRGLSSYHYLILPGQFENLSLSSGVLQLVLETWVYMRLCVALSYHSTCNWRQLEEGKGEERGRERGTERERERKRERERGVKGGRT